MTDLINDDYFKSIFENKPTADEKFKIFKYKFLIFILFYNKIVDKEGKRFNNYEGNRKMINDIRLNLFGTTPLEGDWKTSIAGKIIKNGIGLAVNGSVRGILEDNTTLNNKLNNTIFDFNSNNKSFNIKKKGTNDNTTNIIKEIKEKNINDIKEKNIIYIFKKNSKRDVSLQNQSGGNIKIVEVGDKGPLQIIAILLESKGIISNPGEPGELAKTIGLEKNDDNDQTIILLNEFLDTYIKKVFELTKDRYIPALFGIKSSVIKTKGPEDKEIEDEYKKSFKEMIDVQIDLFIMKIYLNRIAFPDDIPDDVNDIGYTSVDISKILDKYGLAEEEKKISYSTGKIYITKDDVKNIQNGLATSIKLKKDVGEKIIEEYNKKASAFDENTKKIEGVLNDSTAGLHDYLINKNYNKILENDKLFIEENKNTLKLFLAPSV